MSYTEPALPKLHGLMAEFNNESSLIAAARQSYAKGYRRMDAYSPFPVEGLSDALGLSKSEMPLLVLIGGIIGAISGYTLQVWASVWSYPMNIGGRPLNSWPSFVPVTFELTILVAALTAVFGMLGLNGFPMPYHPVFNVPSFEQASQTAFFLCIEAQDPLFKEAETRAFLESLKPAGVFDVEP